MHLFPVPQRWDVFTLLCRAYFSRRHRCRATIERQLNIPIFSLPGIFFPSCIHLYLVCYPICVSFIVAFKSDPRIIINSIVTLFDIIIKNMMYITDIKNRVKMIDLCKGKRVLWAELVLFNSVLERNVVSPVSKGVTCITRDRIYSEPQGR